MPKVFGPARLKLSTGIICASLALIDPVWLKVDVVFNHTVAGDFAGQ